MGPRPDVDRTKTFPALVDSIRPPSCHWRTLAGSTGVTVSGVEMALRAKFGRSIRSQCGLNANQAKASTGGHEHTRLRSPYAPSMRRTGGHTFGRKCLPSG